MEVIMNRKNKYKFEINVLHKKGWLREFSKELRKKFEELAESEKKEKV